LIKTLQLLKEMAPSASRVGILMSSQTENADAFRLLQTAAASLALQLHAGVIDGPGDFDRVFAAITKERIEALLVLPSHSFIAHRKLLVDLAARHALPTAYWWSEMVKIGGLMSYGVEWRDLFTRAANYVDKILKGARPADLPIEQPTKFELLINMKTAKALGLTIPSSLLLRADHVVE
jgi:putative ABC transport system substrate-binding protein